MYILVILFYNVENVVSLYCFVVYGLSPFTHQSCIVSHFFMNYIIFYVCFVIILRDVMVISALNH